MLITILQYINIDKTNLRHEKIYKSIQYIEKPHKVVIVRNYSNDDYQIEQDKYYKDMDNVYIYHNKVGKGLGQHIYLLDYLMKKAGVERYLLEENDVEYLNENVNRVFDKLDRDDKLHPINHLISDSDVGTKRESTNLMTKSGKISTRGFKHAFSIRNGVKLPTGDIIEWLRDLQGIGIRDGMERYEFVKNTQTQFTKIDPLWFLATDTSMFYYLVKKYGGFKYRFSTKYFYHHASDLTSCTTSKTYTFDEMQQIAFNHIYDTDFDLLEKEFMNNNKNKISKLKKFLRN